jgi:hypothetical protein
MTMKTYKVKWEIEVTANNPRKAARQALAIQRDQDSIAVVFDVDEWLDSNGLIVKSTRIDLLSS